MVDREDPLLALWKTNEEEVNDDILAKGEGLIPFADFSLFPFADDSSDLEEEEYFISSLGEIDGLNTGTQLGLFPFPEQDNPIRTYLFEQNISSSSPSDNLFMPSDNLFMPSKINTNQSGTVDLANQTNIFDVNESLQIVTSSFDNQANNDLQKEVKNDIIQKKSKPFQDRKWDIRFREFLAFVKENGHGSVPHSYPKNQKLSRWVKRQRQQYKLWNDGKPSNINAKRFDALTQAGFVWDAHELNWREKVEALKRFRYNHGHSSVPTKYKDENLGTWVKCQRRQYKLYCEGKPSAMNAKRFAELDKLDFEWEIHNVTSKRSKILPA